MNIKHHVTDAISFYKYIFTRLKRALGLEVKVECRHNWKTIIGNTKKCIYCRKEFASK